MESTYFIFRSILFVKSLSVHAKHVDGGIRKLIKQNWTQDELLRARSQMRESEAQLEKGGWYPGPQENQVFFAEHCGGEQRHKKQQVRDGPEQEGMGDTL